NKLLGLSPLVVDRIYTKEIYDVILVEADGSKRKPIKAPNHHEPVIPKGTTRVVGVIGLDALGKEINEMTVHRPHLFCKVTNSIMGELIDTSKVVALTTHREGLFKNTPTNSRRYLLLNKSEDPEKQQKALEIIDAVKKTKNIDGFIVGNMKDNKAFITWSEDN
ncbi:MAG: putative selenium-dependent hydroxylase accessory protein YqeC, partial [Clostridiaceae bacterium]|nr:putative selenium-dependent hydroxylase accessory protein YqeC [Clostridiaceae bacterium]